MSFDAEELCTGYRDGGSLMYEDSLRGLVAWQIDKTSRAISQNWQAHLWSAWGRGVRPASWWRRSKGSPKP